MAAARRAAVVGLLACALVVGVTVAVTRSGGGSERSEAPPATLGWSATDLVNPMRGQFENIATDLFPQANPDQGALPDWPGTQDASIRVTWRMLQPTDPRGLAANVPDDQRFDFSLIDRALAQYWSRGIRVGLRISSFNSCCESIDPGGTNIEVPDWLAATPGAVERYDLDGVEQVIPSWNDPAYLDPFADLLAALGRRYDGDERLAVFEMSGYGDFSENQVALLRDQLGRPGPTAADSERVLGYYAPYRDQVITADSVRSLVQANLTAFPRTQMVTATANPEIVRQLMGPAADAFDLQHPVGVRGDCLGVFGMLPAWATEPTSAYVERADPLIEILTERLRTAPVLAEWCQLPDGESPRRYYERARETVMTQHVSMTASTGFPDQLATTAMPRSSYALWRESNVFAGYRYAASAALAVDDDGAVRARVRWTNLGVSSTHERWAVTYRLLDAAGAVVATATSGLDLRELDTEQDADRPTPTPVSATDPVVLGGPLPAGTYTLTATVAWAEHKPDASVTVDLDPMQLALDGRTADGAYPLGAVTVGGR